MATALNTAALENVLQCPICMDTFNDPKELSCNHQFCKQCIEQLLQFNADGGASIMCPNRCAQRTLITATGTADDLRVSYEFKAVLEMLGPGNQVTDVPSSMRCLTDGCKKDVCVYCCGVFLCRTCGINHEGSQQEHQSKTNIMFDAKDNKLKVLCQEHSTTCTHLSSDNSFLCVYCLNRTHKQHVKVKINEQAAKIREYLTNDCTNLQHIEEIRKSTQESISQGEMNLNRTLHERKIICLANYIQRLNTEEELIKKNYKNVFDKHQQKYSSTISPDYFHCNLQKDDIQIILEKDSIVQQLSHYNLAAANIQPVSVSLSETFGIGYDFDPLGELNISLQEETLFCNISSPTFRYNESRRDTFEFETNVCNLTEEIKKLEVEMAKYQRQTNEPKMSVTGTSNNEDERTNMKSNSSVRTDDVRKRPGTPKMDRTNQITAETSMKEDEEKRKGQEWLKESIKMLERQGYAYIEKLITKKDNNNLRLLLSKRNDIVRMRSANDVTPLHVAARHTNLDSLEMLLQYGAEIDSKNKYGRTALHVAARHDCLDSMKMLVQHGARVDSKGGNDVTALHYATESGSVACLSWLVQQYPHMIDMRDKYGGTALHSAVDNNNFSCLQVLLQHGVDVHVHENNDYTALDLAIITDNQQFINALKKHCACAKCK